MLEWDLFEDAEPQGSSNGFWYDLTDGGYIDLSKFIKDPAQLEKALVAVKTLESLQKTLDGATLLNEF
ncbi:hypothetical protein LCGC14_2442470 [marine sediment metagenome]|uniref:Uncharacterized protein n=1 Tax=marine sediment metagenome TaxID=412755 RepID=A0A0F9C618_9ZZZZ